MQDQAVCLFRSVSEMPTAIARIRTDEGFVIAADGRAYDHTAGKVTSDSVQKIFQVKGPPMACSVSGDIKIDFATFQFDFVLEVGRILERDAPTLDFGNYAIWVGDAVRTRMIQAGRPEISSDAPYRSDEIRASILLDGYTPSGEAGQWALRFFPQRRHWFSFNTDDLFVGSREITRVLKNPHDSRLKAYRRTEPTTLEEAKETAVAFIQAHTDEEAQAIDPHTFRSVGKRIHMATITIEQGFQWVPGFEPPISSCTAP